MAGYQCPPHVAWAVERKGIFLVNGNSGAIHYLCYPRACVWDLINRSYGFDQTVRMVSAITVMDTGEAEQLIRRCLKAWHREGFLFWSEEVG